MKLVESDNIDLKGQADLIRTGSGDSKKDRFLLSKDEWKSIQVFTYNVKALPATDTEIRIKFKLTQNDDVKNFSGVRDLYARMVREVGEWDNALNLSIGVAERIETYGNNAENLYYKELKNLAKKGLTDQVNKKRFIDILDNRVKEIDEIMSDVGKVNDGVAKYRDAVERDIKDLANVRRDLDGKYGDKNDEVKQLQEDIKRYLDEIKKLSEEHTKLWEQSSTLQWTDIFYIFSLGGPYAKYKELSDKSEEIQGKINDLKKKYQKDKETLDRNIAITTSVKAADASLDATRDHAKKAYDTLNRIVSGWTAIKSSLTNLKTLVDKDVRKAESLVDMQIDDAISRWVRLADECGNYKTNCYVKFVPHSLVA